MFHRLHSGDGEGVVAAEDIYSSYRAVGPDNGFEADPAREGRRGCFRIAKSALRRLRNLQARLLRRVILGNHRRGNRSAGRFVIGAVRLGLRQ